MRKRWQEDSVLQLVLHSFWGYLPPAALQIDVRPPRGDNFHPSLRGDQHQFRSVAQDFLDHYQGIDLLINNAGVGEAAELDQFSLELWLWTIGINLNGVLYGCHHFIPSMKQQGSG